MQVISIFSHSQKLGFCNKHVIVGGVPNLKNYSDGASFSTTMDINGTTNSCYNDGRGHSYTTNKAAGYAVHQDIRTGAKTYTYI